MTHPLLTKRWLYRADQDFGFASLSSGNGCEYYDQPCFFFQQAAEKYLKAYLIHGDLPFEKIHDLLRLLEVCSQEDASFKELEDEAAVLNRFYVETRYPEPVFVKFTREDMYKARSAVQKIQQLVRGKLGVDHEITTDEIKKAEEEADRQFRQQEKDAGE
ncbi:MAG: HEPN domain protein [candidate division CPR1 bacterium GW2011_GWA2_42_17]|uniref:HEPN domain protein n=1 Tax=candidate division CPR1 bacterium GW2011_GWA2_42_17 TaxID=1618341 RepID=A0A0G1B4C6_9BACT|nr:MAG: HEPN domain protein [candidate division CPR1 bacterium GW2011_GWA2_42_17]